MGVTQRACGPLYARSSARTHSVNPIVRNERLIGAAVDHTLAIISAPTERQPPNTNLSDVSCGWNEALTLAR